MFHKNALLKHHLPYYNIAKHQPLVGEITVTSPKIGVFGHRCRWDGPRMDGQGLRGATWAGKMATARKRLWWKHMENLWKMRFYGGFMGLYDDLG